MEIANIYDNGPISPIAKIGENLAIYKDNTWIAYKIQWFEGIPQSSPFVVDFVLASGVLNIPPGGQTNKAASVVLSMTENEMLHLRWEPIDDVEGMLWELNESSRYTTMGAQARTSPFTSRRDPWLATTTFFVLGQNISNTAVIGAFNPWAIAQPTARFAFWGFRYVLTPMGVDPRTINATYLPARGR
jgi:hypothetical protein